MKICFIVPKAYPLLNKEFANESYGGAEVQIVSLAKRLASIKDMEISIITGIYDDKKKDEVVEGVKIVQAVPRSGSVLYKLKKMFGLLGVLKKVDADHYVQRALNPFTFVFALLLKIFRKNFVYMVASDGEVDGNHYMYNKFYLKLLIKPAFRMSSIVICQNNYEEDLLREGFKVKNLVLLRKGMITKPFVFNDNCKYDAIWIGRTTPRKRTDLFIDLARDFPENKFLMLCTPALETDEFTKAVRKADSELDNLDAFFSVDHDRVIKYIQESKMHILTSEVEGDLSMTTLEACQWGVPTINMYIDHELLIHEFEGGIYCEGGYERLKESFEKISSDSEYRLERGKGAHELIEEHYNMEKNVKKFVDILGNI